jgi:hypothetical protein
MTPFDPHPAGCPIGLRVDPAQMQELVRSVWAKLRDVVDVGVFVVNPSKGDSYPILYLAGNDRGARRVALFPAWEDVRRKRPIDYGRQTALLQRIQDAGIAPESLDSTHGVPSERLGPGPVYVALDLAPQGMSQVVHDLWERLGAYLRLTVRQVTLAGAEATLVSAYVLDDEPLPRLVLYPGQTARGEAVSVDEVVTVDTRARTERTGEKPIEALFSR